MGRPGVLLYFDLLPALDKLPPESVGKLLLSALHYAEDGREPVFEDSSLDFAWAFIRPSIDRDGDTYKEKQERGEWLTYCRQCKRDGTEPLTFEDWQRSSNGTLRTDTAPYPSTSTSTSTSHLHPISNTSTSTTKREADKPPARFVPPTVEEVQAYIDEQGYTGVNAAAFVDFYTANGWVQGKGKPIKDWKAAVRTWARREKQSDPEPESRMELVTNEDGTQTWRMKT